MLDNRSKSLIRALLYPVQFERQPEAGVDRVLDQVVAPHSLDASPDDYLGAISSALKSDEALAALLPQSLSEEAVRKYLSAVATTLERGKSARWAHVGPMGVKDAFAPEDWARVVGAPMLAAIAVTAADPGGLWGALKESAAAAGSLRDAKGSARENPLIAAIVAAYDTPEGRNMARSVLKAGARGRSPGEVVDVAVGELGAVAALVASNAPEAAPGFKAWLGAIAAHVAEAGSEGGFLGFGGEKVSASEKATLDRLATALD